MHGAGAAWMLFPTGAFSFDVDVSFLGLFNWMWVSFPGLFSHV